jgi:hypothetical protein
MSRKLKQKAIPTRILHENPYDLETFFESLSIASNNDKELLFVDRFVSALRANPQDNITNITYNILRELEIINLEKN